MLIGEVNHEFLIVFIWDLLSASSDPLPSSLNPVMGSQPGIISALPALCVLYPGFDWGGLSCPLDCVREGITETGAAGGEFVSVP